MVQIHVYKEHNIISLDDNYHGGHKNELSKYPDFHHNISDFSYFVLLNVCNQSPAPAKFPFPGMSNQINLGIIPPVVPSKQT